LLRRHSAAAAGTGQVPPERVW